MNVLEFIEFYKDIMPRSEHSFFSEIVPAADRGEDCISACFIARYDTDRAVKILSSAIKSISQAEGLALACISLESVYIRSKNEEILNTGYVFLKNHLLNMEKEGLDQPFFLALVCDMLRFFASALHNGEKTAFIQKRNEHLSKIQQEDNSILSLAPAYLMAYSPEEAGRRISSACFKAESLKTDSLSLLYFALHGLMTYGYEHEVRQIKEALLSYPYNKEDSSAAALLAEIFLLG